MSDMWYENFLSHLDTSNTTVRISLAIIGGGLSLFIGQKLRKTWTERQLRKEWHAIPKDTVVLHQFSRGKYCPNLSPFALKVEAYLRLAKINYVVDTKMPFGPKGKCPWITLNGEEVGDSEFIIEKLESHFNVKLDERLSSEEKAVLEAVRVLVDEHLFWCVIAWRYWLDKGESFLKSQALPSFIAFYFRVFMVGAIKHKSMIQGIGKHSPEEIYLICKKDCDVLSKVLGTKNFFGGDRHSTADCAIFGELSQLMWNAPESKYEELIKGTFKNLEKYCLRMKETVYPDWENLLVK